MVSQSTATCSCTATLVHLILRAGNTVQSDSTVATSLPNPISKAEAMPKLELERDIQLPLYQLATRAIASFVSESGEFIPFALATACDGEIQVLQASDEYPDCESAERGLLDTLITLGKEESIIGCLLCGPVVLPSTGLQVGATMEIEAVGCTPIRVMLQIRHASGVPTLAEDVTMMPGCTQVF